MTCPLASQGSHVYVVFRGCISRNAESAIFAGSVSHRALVLAQHAITVVRWDRHHPLGRLMGTLELLMGSLPAGLHNSAQFLLVPCAWLQDGDADEDEDADASTDVFGADRCFISYFSVLLFVESLSPDNVGRPAASDRSRQCRTSRGILYIHAKGSTRSI